MKRSLTLLTISILLSLESCQQKQDFDATGIFETDAVTISAETNGKILHLAPIEGDTVHIGDILGQIDTTSLALQKKQIAWQHAAMISNTPDMQAQEAALRAQIEHARNNAQRIQKLYESGAATLQQRDDAHAQLLTLQAQLEGQTSSLSKNRANISDNASAIKYQLEQIDEQIAKSRISSPLSGTILTKFAQPGEFATAGKPLYKIADLNNIYLRAYFTTRQLANLRLGQKVTVIADYGDNITKEYPGTIRWIAQESEFTPKSIQTPSSRANLVYAVKISVTNDGTLKLGQYGEVKLNK